MQWLLQCCELFQATTESQGVTNADEQPKSERSETIAEAVKKWKNQKRQIMSKKFKYLLPLHVVVLSDLFDSFEILFQRSFLQHTPLTGVSTFYYELPPGVDNVNYILNCITITRAEIRTL